MKLLLMHVHFGTLKKKEHYRSTEMPSAASPPPSIKQSTFSLSSFFYGKSSGVQHSSILPSSSSASFPPSFFFHARWPWLFFYFLALITFPLPVLAELVVGERCQKKKKVGNKSQADTPFLIGRRATKLLFLKGFF